MNQEEWDKTEKEFLVRLNNYFSEINSSIEVLKKNENNPLIKSQLCLAFVGADTFSRFKLIFNGGREELNRNNKERFENWFKAFVFTEENEVYLKNKEKINCNAERAWQIRNALLHFYSFPEPENGYHIEFLYNSLNLFQKELNDFSLKKGRKIILIDVYYFINAILHGFLLQLKGFTEMIRKNPKHYIDSVLFAHKIIMGEGAFTVQLKEKNYGA